MFNNTRKYCLNIGNIISSGITSKITADSYNLLNQFSVNNCNYSKITSNELSNLSHPEYLERVSNFLSYLDIEDTNIRENLINNASYYDPNCEIKCDLKSNFLVYKFLDGVRVIDIGEVFGEAQYRAYPIEQEASGYTWQITPTFFNLDLTKTYVFEVRDVINNEEFCKVKKTVSLPTLVQSTTFIPEEKLVYIDSNYNNGEGYYHNGTVKIEPLLKDNEMVSLNYYLAAFGSYDGESCIQLYCKPKNENNYIKYCCHTSNDNNSFDTIDLYSGDQLCYNIRNITPTAGSFACASFELNSVDGGGTTSPLIDISRNCAYKCVSQPKEEITMSISNQTIINENDYEKIESGIFEFSPEIPVNEEFKFKLSGLTTAESVSGGATPISNISAYIEINCKPSTGFNYENIVTHNLKNPQPLIKDITVRSGDEICYEIGVVTNDGSITTSSISLLKPAGSQGIEPIIGSPSTTNIYKVVSADARIVSMCNQHTQIGSSQSIGDGYINVNESLNTSEEIKIDFNADLSILSNENQVDNNACAIIYCKKASYSDFVIKCEMTTQTTSDNYTGDLTIVKGDMLCYKVVANAAKDSIVTSTLSLENVDGSGGIYAILNDNENKRNDSVTVSTLVFDDPNFS